MKGAIREPRYGEAPFVNKNYLKLHYLRLRTEVKVWKFKFFKRFTVRKKWRGLDMQSVTAVLFFGVNLVWNIRQIFAWETESADVR
jgi:hypothetical protein